MKVYVKSGLSLELEVEVDRNLIPGNNVIQVTRYTRNSVSQ
jgi:hypothetical protein